MLLNQVHKPALNLHANTVHAAATYLPGTIVLLQRVTERQADLQLQSNQSAYRPSSIPPSVPPCLIQETCRPPSPRPCIPRLPPPPHLFTKYCAGSSLDSLASSSLRSCRGIGPGCWSERRETMDSKKCSVSLVQMRSFWPVRLGDGKRKGEWYGKLALATHAGNTCKSICRVPGFHALPSPYLFSPAREEETVPLSTQKTKEAGAVPVACASCCMQQVI